MSLNIVSKTRLVAFWTIHAKAKGPLTNWYNTTRKANWASFSDVKKTYRSADFVNQVYVFDVSSFRVVADIAFTTGHVYIKHVFIHTEYDKWTQGQR
jgi:mRNA interferase HigB